MQTPINKEKKSMKCLVLFNDCTQRAEDFIENEIIVYSLIDKHVYDYVLRLYFDYEFSLKPKLTSFKLTKLNNKEKYHYVFLKIDSLEDNSLLIRDLKEMIRLKEIDSFDIKPIAQNLLAYTTDLLGIAHVDDSFTYLPIKK